MSACVCVGNSTLRDKIVAYTELHIELLLFLTLCVWCVCMSSGMLTASRCEEVRQGSMLLNGDSLEFDRHTISVLRFERIKLL